MKLRKVGNSLGTTFSRELLAKAGFAEGQELEVVAEPGVIKIMPATAGSVVLELSAAEAKALAEGKLRSKAALTALHKLRRVLNKERT